MKKASEAFEKGDLFGAGPLANGLLSIFGKGVPNKLPAWKRANENCEKQLEWMKEKGAELKPFNDDGTLPK